MQKIRLVYRRIMFKAINREVFKKVGCDRGRDSTVRESINLTFRGRKLDSNI